VLVIGKANVATAAQIDATTRAARALNSDAPVVVMEMAERVDHPDLIRGHNVLVIEDGPSVTHGGLAEVGAARAARQLGATLVDPRPYAVGSIAKAYSQFPHLGPVLPALGYTRAQREELRQSIAAVPCSAILLGTPADLAPLLPPGKPVARVSVAAKDMSAPTLAQIVLQRLAC
jgi:predicted GTPase